MSFIGLTQFLFSLPKVMKNNLAFLSNKLCQDPLEQFFGCQRQRGGTSDNVLEFCCNTQALRIVDSFCRAPVRGNCCRKRVAESDVPKDTSTDLMPLSLHEGSQFSWTAEMNHAPGSYVYTMGNLCGEKATWRTKQLLR